MKLTAKQKEVINLALETEKELDCKVYFRYHPIKKKVYIVRLDGITDTKYTLSFLKEVHGATVNKLDENGILVLEKIKDELQMLTINKEMLITA